MKRQPDQSVVLKHLGARLREIRQAKGLTQEQVSEDAGFSRSYYTEIETGKRNISIFNLYKIAKCLNVQVSDLFDFDSGRTK